MIIPCNGDRRLLHPQVIELKGSSLRETGGILLGNRQKKLADDANNNFTNCYYLYKN